MGHRFRGAHALFAATLAALAFGALSGCFDGKVGAIDAGETGAGDGGPDVGTGDACAVVAILQTRCSACHGATPAEGAPMSLTSLDDLRAPSIRDAAQSNGQRSVARMHDTVSPMPPLTAARATAEEIATMAAWVADGMPECETGGEDGGTGPYKSPNLIPQDQLFQCQGLASDAPSRLRRINRWQWTRNVGGSVTREWTGFSFYDNPLDPSITSPYWSYAADDTIDDTMVEIMLPLLGEYGATWAGPYTGGNRLELLRNSTSLRCMWDDAAPDQDCIEHYAATLLERGVLYRPPKPAELSHLVDFAKAVLAEEVPDGTQDPRTHSISRIVGAAMMTSGALFREELGTPDGNGRLELSDWELAQQLTYALGDRGPGAVPLWRYPDFSAPEEGHYADVADAARDGTISDPAVVAALVDANFGGVDPARADLIQDFGENRRTRRGEYWLGDGAANFFRQWLGYTKVEEIFKERPEATSAYDDGNNSGYRPQLSAWGQLMSGYYGYESTMVQQMDDFVARAVEPDVNVLQTLLTSRQYFLAATASSGFDGDMTRYTGQPYNTEVEIDANNPAERWQTLPADERAGVLTHPAWLASHGNNFEDDPSAVHRGKWVREKLLCQYVPPLSEVKVMAKVGPHSPAKSARVRLEEATASQQCQTCHALMNPIGLTFEIYNHAGYVRVQDHAPDGGFEAPSGAVTLTNMPEPALNGPVKDAVELSEKLADSPHVKRCFIRQVFRYYMGRDENLTDACTLAQMEQAYDANNGSFRSMLKALMTSDTWTTRRAPAKGE